MKKRVYSWILLAAVLMPITDSLLSLTFSPEPESVRICRSADARCGK